MRILCYIIMMIVVAPQPTYAVIDFQKALAEFVADCANPLSSSDAVPEQQACVGHKAAMAAVFATTFTMVMVAITTATLGIGTKAAVAAATASGITAVAAYGALIAGIALAAARQTKGCETQENGGHPYPYTDQQIKNILISQNETPRINAVVKRYKDICIQYALDGGKSHWIKENECVTISGMVFCAFRPYQEEPLLCARVSSTCPCTANIGLGTLKAPDMQKDSNGKELLDKQGNPKYVNEEDFRERYMKHCRMIREPRPTPLPSEYTGIIDEACNSWGPYSKIQIPMTSAVVQCLQATARNIFEKPVISGASTNTIEVTPLQKVTNDQYIYYKNTCNDIMNKITYIVNSSTGNLANHAQMNDVRSGINMLITNKNKVAKDITIISELNPLQQYNGQSNTYIITDLNARHAELQRVYRELDSKHSKFLGETQKKNYDSKKITMFQHFQGSLKAMGFIVIILWLTMIGFRIVFGEISLNLSSIFNLVYSFAMIFYFSMGDAWKDYFFNMLFNVSFGLGEIFSSISYGEDTVSKSCHFGLNHYFADQAATCSFPNPNLKGSTKPFVVEVTKQGVERYGCLKGEFIPRPNYERPYKPVAYQHVENDQFVSKLLPVYCLNSSGGSIAASVNKNLVNDDEQGIFECPSNTRMEQGYRMSELIKMGIVNISEADAGENYQLLPTASYILDQYGMVSEVDIKGTKEEKAQDRMIRANRIKYLESSRVEANAKERRYPIIEKYGTKRDMQFISAFDTIDCKIRGYFTYRIDEGFKATQSTYQTRMQGVPQVFNALWGAVFGLGILGLILLIMQLLSGLLIVGIVGHITQTYLMSIIAIIILVYLSPVFIPLQLFERTNSLYEDWFDKLKGYVIHPPMLFLLLSIAIIVMDYLVYGSPNSFKLHNMFTPEGIVDGEKCWASDIQNAPIICLISKLGTYVKTTDVLGTKIPTVDISSEVVQAMFLQSVKMIVSLYIMLTFVEKAESLIISIFGRSDTNAGTIFDKIGGVSELAKQAGGGVLGAIKDRVTRKPQPANTNKKDGDKQGGEDKADDKTTSRDAPDAKAPPKDSSPPAKK